MTRIVAVAIVLYFALDPALQFGAIWNLRANPAEGVEVTLERGEVLRGALSREWSGEWVVLRDGGAVHFTRFASMSFHAPPAMASDNAIQQVLRGWRSLAPTMILLVACFVTVISLVVPPLRRDRERPSA